MNIAIFTDTYYPDTNGIAVNTKNLVDVLKANGNNVIVITSVFDDKVPTTDNGVYYISFSSKRKRSVLTTTRIYELGIFKEVKAFKPDIVHNQTNDQIGQLGRYTADKLKIPFVYTYHTHFEEYASYVKPTIFNRIRRARERSHLKRMMNVSTEFIAPSLKIKNYLRKKGIDKYINVIPSAIDVSEFEIDETTKKDSKYFAKKYGVGPKDKVLLYVGALSMEKNINLLVNCVSKYMQLEDKPRIVLLIVGEGNEWDVIKEQTESLGLSDCILLVGKVNHEKIKSYYEFADLYVTASTSETQSITAMEAMATNCLVLAKEDETLDGFLIKDKNGFTFQDEDDFVKELDKIFALKPETVEKIKKAGFKTIVDNFNEEQFYNRVMEVYNRAKRKKW